MGISLVVHWLRSLCASSAGGSGSIPDQGESICLKVQPKKNKTTKKTPLYFISDLCHYFRKALLLKSDLNSLPSVS